MAVLLGGSSTEHAWRTDRALSFDLAVNVSNISLVRTAQVVDGGIFIDATSAGFSGLVVRRPLELNATQGLRLTLRYDKYNRTSSGGADGYTPRITLKLLRLVTPPSGGTSILPESLSNLDGFDEVASAEIRQYTPSTTSYVDIGSEQESTSATCIDKSVSSTGLLRALIDPDASSSSLCTNGERTKLGVVWLGGELSEVSNGDSTLEEVCAAYPSSDGWIEGPCLENNMSYFVAVGVDLYYGSVAYGVRAVALDVSIRDSSVAAETTTTLEPTLPDQPISTATTTTGPNLATTAAAVALHKEYFPSIQAAWILPGLTSVPTFAGVVDAGISSATDVEIWEWRHGDINMGGSSGRSPISLGYMYNQMLDFDPSDLQFQLRYRSVQLAQNASISPSSSPAVTSVVDGPLYENFTLHFDVDTVFDMDLTSDPSHGSATSIFGVPFKVGYTASTTHSGFVLYQDPPWNVDAWSGQASGGSLFVLSFERFDALQLALNSTRCAGDFIVEYVSAVDNTRRFATQWTPVELIDDYFETSASATSRVPGNASEIARQESLDHPYSKVDLPQYRVLRWKPPVDWYIATLNDGTGVTYGGGQYFGNTDLTAKSGLVFAVRISWKEFGDSSCSRPPLLNSVYQRRWISPVGNISHSFPVIANASYGPRLSFDDRYLMIPGWDPSNDRDNDGYVDDYEFENRNNLQASARMRHEARVIPLGKMWSTHSAWCIRNVWNDELRLWVSEYAKHEWMSEGLAGAYNDDMFKLVGPEQFKISRGGNVSSDIAMYGLHNLAGTFGGAFVEHWMHSHQYVYVFSPNLLATKCNLTCAQRLGFFWLSQMVSRSS